MKPLRDIPHGARPPKAAHLILLPNEGKQLARTKGSAETEVRKRQRPPPTKLGGGRYTIII